MCDNPAAVTTEDEGPETMETVETQPEAAAPTESIFEMPTNLDNVKRTIMIPVDSSDHTLRAVNWYLANMNRPDDLVIFVHIVEPMYESYSYGIMDAPPLFNYDLSAAMDRLIAEGKILCQSYMTKLKELKILHKAYIHIDSRPGQALVRSCSDHQIDMTVMANRGVGMMHRTFLGSVSDYVLHHSHRPLVIVPPIDKTGASGTTSSGDHLVTKEKEP